MANAGSVENPGRVGHPPEDWYQGYVFDLDGTVWLAGRPLPGAVEALTELYARGRRCVFVSNNTLRSAAAYASELRSLGIPASPADVITPAALTCEYLKAHGFKRVHAIGEAPLRQQLRGAGFDLALRPEDVQCVVASFDRHLTYAKLLLGHRAIELGAAFVATNADRACPMDDGFWPDAAAVIGALEGSTGVRVKTVMGKPSARMMEAALRRLGLPPSACVMVGDRVEADVRMARRSGVAAALVLTGAGASGGGAEEADFVVADLRQMLPGRP
ncbi:MAG: HAD-IIA family hydrolase [Candidatus Dormibacteria bacterium]